MEERYEFLSGELWKYKEVMSFLVMNSRKLRKLQVS